MTDPATSAVQTVKRFFFAVTIGDGEAVWDELSERGRAYVLNVALQQGMDFELGSQLRQGSATSEAVGAYLDNLVHGIRRDLDGIDLSNLSYDTEAADGGRVRVRFVVPLGLTLRKRSDGAAMTPDPRASIPAGSAVVAPEVGRWRIDRLVPRPGA